MGIALVRCGGRGLARGPRKRGPSLGRRPAAPSAGGAAPRAPRDIWNKEKEGGGSLGLPARPAAGVRRPRGGRCPPDPRDTWEEKKEGREPLASRTWSPGRSR